MFNKSVLASFLLISLVSCGFMHRNTIGLFSESDAKAAPPGKIIPSANPVKVSVEKLDLAEQNLDPSSAVEIVWEIPKEPVEGFVIHYGYSKDKLEYEKKITSIELEKFEDPTHGFVYRHLLGDIATEKKLYVAVSAFNTGIESEPSEVLEVSAADVKPKS